MILDYGQIIILVPASIRKNCAVIIPSLIVKRNYVLLDQTVPLEHMQILLLWVVKVYVQILHILVILQLIYALLCVQLLLIIILKVGNVHQAALEGISQIGKLIELVLSNVQVAQYHSMEPLLFDASKLLNAE